MKILVSGAGVAGLSLGYDLGIRGHHVTIVERADHLRGNGSPIDIRGDAIEIAEKMGLLPAIHDARIRMTEQVHFVDENGTAIGRLPDDIGDSPDDIEIDREDLYWILANALPETVDLRLSQSVNSIAEHDDRVDVGFASGDPESYDLVLGADGMHSTVRRLVFGPERNWIRHLGLYVASIDMPGEADAEAERINPMFNYPGHLAGIGRFKDKAIAVMMFASDLIDYDYRDVEAKKKILFDQFAECRSWKVPAILDAVRDDPDIYFDSVSQIHMPTWHRGRVALVGDAGYCASPLAGRGTSLAMIGAQFLAEELDRSDGDHVTAFPRYEARMRPYVEFAQGTVEGGAALIVPPTQEAIIERNQMLQPVEAGQ
ncbi:2-polyprenyl-6-methoxyphenol hydroxylase-like FAD-dependent oxidoreductase [Prauserella shujinwangii]|uniref:2-polyprenyl-6-methoxyphenol hydroxylase-like FAD-dependent oxidoreductase n=1 Tax=Prauserella shujinwangii TaxID=1453103 RepID=A0A2T0M0H2_9PSEU|nr:FAD-dependent monooxygenase [Prauserella shujinwangii]PRX50081.1 2-polyprenyl-6-methoxyphenol hydroxylase-like FAD-dependent oxidoreductase [Prauserella shujinwangii]